MKSNNMSLALFLVGLLIILGMLYVAYLFFFQRANPPLSKNTVTVGNAVFTVEIASTTAEQARGLSFRDSLGEGEGMFFLFDSPGVQNFWMKDMKFSIDIIWIAGDKVAGFAQNAEPQPGVALWNLRIYSSPDYVDKVLEVNAGTAEKDGIKIGDEVKVQL